VLIGLAGKVLGPGGFVWAASSGRLPWAFGWTILTNDLIWWPSFGMYLREYARSHGGWKKMVVGGGE
jgi:small multidrug resistance pump